MSRNYTRRSQAKSKKRKSESRVPAWVWLFTGAVLGAFIMFLIHLSGQTSSQTAPENLSPPDEEEKKAQTKPDSNSPEFTFYDLLKESEVISPSRRPSKPANVSEKPTKFIIQVASLRSEDDAQRARAELILLNLDATVKEVTLRNGEKWNRVMVGPFTDRSKMAKARSTLVSNGFEAQVHKMLE